MNLPHPIRRLVAWFGEREPVVLLLSLLVVATVWGFIVLAGEVFDGDTEAFDTWAVRAMRQPDDLGVPIGSPWIQEMGRDATALGGIGALVFFTVVAAGYLGLVRRVPMMCFLLAATLGGIVMSLGLKHVFSRPRPDVVPHLSFVHTSSFPSGHALLSAVVYLTLGALLARAMPRKRLKLYVLVVALAMTCAVGVSRVYLGVHYPTDVLAGWMAGLIWALLCWLTARRLFPPRVNRET